MMLYILIKEKRYTENKNEQNNFQKLKTLCFRHILFQYHINTIFKFNYLPKNVYAKPLRLTLESKVTDLEQFLKGFPKKNHYINS